MFVLYILSFAFGVFVSMFINKLLIGIVKDD